MDRALTFFRLQPLSLKRTEHLLKKMTNYGLLVSQKLELDFQRLEVERFRTNRVSIFMFL